MKTATRKQLEGMEGKTFQYGTHIHYVVKVQINNAEEQVSIFTNQNEFGRKFEAIEEFLTYWEPLNRLPAPIAQSEDHPLQMLLEAQEDAAMTFTDILKDNIAKVRENKEYIPQAAAICANINTYVNFSRLQMAACIQLYNTRKAH